jgi:hypothetical protein
MAVDPIHQFQITKLFTIGHIGGQEIAFTSSSAYMFGSVAVISLLMIGGSARRQLVPGRASNRPLRLEPFPHGRVIFTRAGLFQCWGEAPIGPPPKSPVGRLN